MNRHQNNSFCALFILFLTCSYTFGELVKMRGKASHGNNLEDNNTAVQVIDNTPQQLVTRAATTVRIVRRRSVYYKPANKRYPKGAVYSRYKTPRFYITYKCPARVGLFLCRKSCEKRSPNVIGSCDNGYCICLLLTPGFRGRGVFARRAKCSLQSQRVKCTRYCKYVFGKSTYGACRGRICRCFTHPVAPPGSKQPSACAEAMRKLKIMEARLKQLLKKPPSARTPADRKLLQKIKSPAKYKDIDSPSSPKRKLSSKKAPSSKSSQDSSRYSKSKPVPKRKLPKAPEKKEPVISEEDDGEDGEEDSEEYASPPVNQILAEKNAKKSSGRTPKKDPPSKTPLQTPEKIVQDDDNDYSDEDPYGQAIKTGILSPGNSKLDTPLVKLRPGGKKVPEEIDDAGVALLKEDETSQKGAGKQDDDDLKESQWLLERKQKEEQERQLKDVGQTPDPRKTQQEDGLKEEGACPLTNKQQEELLEDEPEIIDTWYEDYSNKLAPIRTTQSERASQKATDQILQDPEYEGFLTHLDHEWRYGEDPPRDKLKPSSLLADIYQL